MKKIILSLLCLLLFSGVYAQNDYSKEIDAVKNSYDQEKLNKLYNEYNTKYSQLKNEAEAYALLNNIPLEKYNEDGSFDELQRFSEDGYPIYYSLENVNAAISTRANYLNTGGGLSLNLNGNGLTAYVWDGGPTRLTHQEFDGTGGNNRVSIGDGQTLLNGNSFHSMHVTGTIVASGFQANAKGMSWQANAITNEWTNDVAEATTAAGNGMLISNHSYGFQASSIPDAWFGQYGQDGVDWDNLMYNAPYYLMVQSAGNDGTDDISNGAPLDGNSAYDKLNGAACAKNNMVVASGLDANINPDGSLNSVTRNGFTSEGPTDDYRIKPDIMGNGNALYSSYDNADNAYGTISGTSMASPNVTGTLLLLQEHYNDLNASFMRAATLKGLALHTADDAGPNGPDVVYGWGLLNAKKAAETITTDAAGSGSAIINELTLLQGQTYQITVQSNGVDPLLASISWTDPAGTLNNGTNSTTPALVNDLDLRLSNGSTFTPWRLTNITTNGTGDNVVDPYERVDINGAAGTYTLTVTHKGTLSSGSQNYSLIVTGVVVASTPIISYSTTSGSTIENTDCGFTDIDVLLNIAQAPSADALVTFSVNGASTATSLLDFEVLTPTVTFLNGVTTAQTMTVRVYHDGFVEIAETAIIDFTVNANGGDAVADTNADTYTLTISNDDSIQVTSQNTNVLIEDFEVVTGWTVIDNDGDTEQWGIFNPFAHGNLTGQWAGSITDLAVVGGTGILTPDNFISSPVFTIPVGTTNTQFTFEIGDFGTPEHYAVYFSADKSSAANIIAGTLIEERNSIGNNTETRVVNIASLAGQTGYLSFRHFNTTGNSLLMLDTVDVTAIVEVMVQTAVNTGVTSDTQSLASAGIIYTDDSASGDVMMDITNNQADDYGCLDISVSRAGTGAQSYNGSVAPDLVMDKTFEVTSTQTTAGTGNTSFTFYFTEAEIAGWEAATGLLRANIVIGREIGGMITETSAVTVGAFGSNVTLSGNFSDVRGTYIFGSSGVTIDINNCSRDPNVWFGVISNTWSLGFSPSNIHPAIMLGTYDTATYGSIDSCILLVNGSLNINANDYVSVEGNIFVSGTLTVEHEGSLVQVDDNATVNNNGTINVIKTTPVNTGNSFSILGSPMSGTTRGGAFVDNNVVMYHQTAQFNLDPTVTAVNAGAEHFADAEGDNWNFIPASSPTTQTFPAEGYLVGPTTASVGSGSYDLTYNEGTLNNGVYSFTAIYNLVGTAAENKSNSPNILSNPYASAIDADALITNNAVIDEIYFWEHLTAPAPNGDGTGGTYPGYRFENWNMGDISIRNVGGGIAAPNGAPPVPTQFIASGQGFGIKANAAATVTFNNSLRVTGNNTGYRNSEIERMYVKISNETYALKSSTLIAFTNGATNGYEAMYDTKRLATPISIYSVLEERELAIQGRSVFTTDQVIPLGFRTMVEEEQTYTIYLGSIEGDNLSTATVYLQDNLLNTVTNLTEGSYEFTSNESNQKDRFVIIFNEEQLGNEDVGLESISLYPNPAEDILNIVSPISTITNVEVYDVQGRVIVSATIANKLSFQLDMSSFNTAMYFVKVTTNEGSITKRVLKK